MLLLLLHYPPNKSRRSVQSKLVPIVGTDILHVKYNSFFKWFLNTHWWFFLMRTKPTTAYRYMWSYCSINSVACRSQWPRGLRRGSAAANLLGLWVRIPPWAWLSVSTNIVCCLVEVSAPGWSLVQRSPTECGVSECDHESSTVRTPWPTKTVAPW